MTLRTIILLGGLFSVLAGGVARACPVGFATHRVEASRLTLCWSVADGMLAMEADHPGEVWIGIGFGDQMVGATAVVGRPRSGSVGEIRMDDRTPDRFAPVTPALAEGMAIRFDGTATRLTFRHPLSGPGPVSLLWAVGEEPDFTGHLERGTVLLDTAHGTAATADRTGWLLPHALAMVVAWGILLPAGVLFARFFKVTRDQDYPRVLDNRFWWGWHRGLQYGGVALMTAGAALAVAMTPSHLASSHALLGAAAVLLGWTQVVAGWLRGSKGGPLSEKSGQPRSPDHWRGDHYDMTARRRVFEAVHKTGGYLALAAALAATLLGLSFTGQPAWIWGLVLAPVALSVAVFVRYTRQGRRVSTYHAIWGPGPEHPGNRRAGDPPAISQPPRTPNTTPPCADNATAAFGRSTEEP